MKETIRDLRGIADARWGAKRQWHMAWGLGITLGLVFVGAIMAISGQRTVGVYELPSGQPLTITRNIVEIGGELISASRQYELADGSLLTIDAAGVRLDGKALELSDSSTPLHTLGLVLIFGAASLFLGFGLWLVADQTTFRSHFVQEAINNDSIPEDKTR